MWLFNPRRSGWLDIGLLFIAVGLSAQGFSKVEIAKTKTRTTMNFSIEGIDQSIKRNGSEKYVRLSLNGVERYAAIDYKPGEPELPVIRFYTTGKVRVAYPMLKTRRLNTKTRVYPSQPEVEKIPGVKSPFVIDERVYRRNRFAVNRLRPFEITSVASVRGAQVQLVTLYPVNYNARTGDLLIINQWNISISNETHPKDVARAIAIVFPKSFNGSAALARYKGFKMRLGYKVFDIVYGEDVTSVSGIRSEIQKLYRDKDIGHAILVGDSNLLPAKRADNMSGVTDHYFRAIDTSDYSNDINGPDIGVGRISIRSESELAAVVEKYIRYESAAFQETDWLNQASFLATNDGGYYQVAEGTHDYVIDTYTKGEGFTGSFPEQVVSGGDNLYAIRHSASGNHAKTAAEEGRHLFIYSGHGLSDGWDAPSFSARDIKALSNRDHLPFVIGFACDTGDYLGTETFAEAWQRHPAGAILYLGSFDSSYWGNDDIMQRRMFDGIYSDGFRNFSKIIQHSLLEHWRHYGGLSFSKYYWESYTIFGDPSMNLRTGF